MKNILFVCTGNTCRSPMALGFFKAALSADPELSSSYSASSAGISALDDDKASINSIRVLLADWEIDIAAHRARSITAEDLYKSCLILTMTASHRDTLRALFPQSCDSIYTLREYASGGSEEPDISDPYGGSAELYRRCANEIKKAVDGLVLRLKSS